MSTLEPVVGCHTCDVPDDGGVRAAQPGWDKPAADERGGSHPALCKTHARDFR